mmetsp:Transcript_41356/g.88134  ORF Transcript_41356/g.88134 Transcript_41356/m.88134 type:complete len:231 (+) Transcript_41356:119-811(+)
MTKRKKKQLKQRGKQNDGAADGAVPVGRHKRKREVQVVVCPSAFPDFTTVGGSTSRRRERQRGIVASGDGGEDRGDDNRGGPPALDVQETIREVHKFGAEGFTGAQKKHHANAEYEQLTGRTAKRQKMPTKIVIGMRKKALKREERHKQELRESGVVSHHTSSNSQGKKKKERSKKQSEEELGGGLRGIFGSNRARNTGDRRKMSPRTFGPAPDVGFMRKGMLKVKQSRR